MQFVNDNNTQHKIHLYIMQYEMNVTNRFTTNHKGLKARQDLKTEAERGGEVTCETTSSDLVTTHPFEVFVRLAELIAV